LAAASFIQIPLQVYVGQTLSQFWTEETLRRWLLVTGIPAILLSGLVQEGSKLVPVVIWWWRESRNIDPKLGLAIGAVAGVGFGIFEAQWAHNIILASGWSWQTVQTSGLIALAGFWERFFAVAFHTASGALMGWGLARGWGWQFYLLAAFLHSLLNYSIIPLRLGLMTVIQLEIYIAGLAVLLTIGVLLLRWRRSGVVAEVRSEV
jgi:RsiW-degrading membrane proteinase PrsW (M82 family)